MRVDVQSQRPEGPGQYALRDETGTQERKTLVREDRGLARVSRQMDAKRRAPAAGGRQLPERPLPRRTAARLGHLAPVPLLWLRDSRQPGELLVCLVRRADRLHGLAGGMVQE